jgi:hypothetical protein
LDNLEQYLMFAMLLNGWPEIHLMLY